jgi:hypothetical protein
MTEADAFERIVESYPANVQTLARAARNAIRTNAPTLAEEVDSAARVIGYGVGDGYTGLRCTIILSKGGVKIGFVGSAAWPNEDGLLEGTGKRHKYVVIDSVERTRDVRVVRHIVRSAS